MLKWVLISFLFISAGVYWFLLREIPTPDVLPMALSYIETEPDIYSESEELVDWHEFWKETRLGSFAGSIPDYEWFLSSPSLIYQNGVDTYIVRWEGVPGCVHEQPPVLGYLPTFRSESGAVCDAWWIIEVKIHMDTGTKVLYVRETKDAMNYL